MGCKNPMFGKPSPGGSGHGWKGWYKDWFFRSLRELSYVINVIELNKWSWQSAEQKELAIPYLNFEGQNRNYFADFLVNKNCLIEVKPIKLHQSPQVTLKTEAANKFCKAKGWIFEVVDPVILPYEILAELHNSKKIKFMDKYVQRFREYQ